MQTVACGTRYDETCSERKGAMQEAIEPSGQPEENAAAETWHLVELRLRASGGACVGGTPCGSPAAQAASYPARAVDLESED